MNSRRGLPGETRVAPDFSPECLNYSSDPSRVGSPGCNRVITASPVTLTMNQDAERIIEDHRVLAGCLVDLLLVATIAAVSFCFVKLFIHGRLV